MQAVILAAGNGNRLKPFTLSRSKAMAPLLGRPIVSKVFENIYSAGIRNFVIVIGPNDTPLKNYFISSEFKSAYFDVILEFAVQEKRLGTAHALSCAKKHISQPFVLSACDSLYKPGMIADFVLTHTEQGRKGTLALQEVDESRFSRTGIVGFDENGFINRIIEKPSPEEAPSHMASLPLYIFEPEIMDFLHLVPLSKRGEYELQDAIQLFINKFGSLAKFVTNYRLELTSPDDLLNLNIKLLQEDFPQSKIAQDIPLSCKIVAPVFISKDVEIGENCIIGPNVFLESGAKVESNCVISNSIVLAGGVVAGGSNLSNEVVL